MSRYYILDDDHRPVAVDLYAWAVWFEAFDNRTVAQTQTETCLISTVFLGLDHRFGGGPPMLFETMIFSQDRSEDGHNYGMDESIDCLRHASWDDAEAGHQTAVRRVVKMEADAAAMLVSTTSS